MKIKLCFVSIFLLFCISGCMMGPNYHTPDTKMPQKYLENNTLEQGEEVTLDKWWEKFDDPQLTKLINLAVENNYDLLIAIERIEEARSFYRIKKADLWPEIDLETSIIRQKISQNLFTSSFQGNKIQNFYLFGFDALWEIDLFGKLRRAKEAAFYEILADQESARDVLISLLSEVARTYIDYLALKQKIDLQAKQIQVQEKIYLLASENFSSGLLSEQKMLNEDILLQQLREDFLDLQTLIKQSTYRLSTLLGKQPEEFLQQIPLQQQKVPHVEKMFSVCLPSNLLRRRPDIRKAEKELAISSAEIGVAVAELFPSFSLIGDFNYQANRSQKWFKWASNAWTIGPNINMPLIDFGRRIANVDVKKSINKQRLLAYNNTVILALEDVENALVSYFNTEQKLFLVQDKVKTQGHATNLRHDLFNSGLSDYSEFLESEKLLLEQQDQLINEQRSLNNNLIALIKSLGGGW